MPEGNGAVLTREFVPQEFQDREYIKPWLDKPWDKAMGAEIFKKLDGAESLIGKRPAIPDVKTAKPEEMEKFFEQFRPEKAEDYEIPLDKDAKPNDAFLKAVRSAFHEGKISKVQAGKFLATMDNFGREQRKVIAQEQAKKDQEFDTLAKTMLGEENKPTMERVKKLISEHAPSVAKASIAKLDDNNLLIMAAVIDAIHKKYAPEDDLGGKGGKGGSGNGGAGTTAEKRERARALILEVSKLKPMDPSIASKQATINALYEEIAAAGT